MPGKSTPVRLSKAAKEFNVGISTIVEFLTSKGYEVENNPNYKIDNAVYEVLVDEFQDSKKLKEKAKLVGVSSAKRETVSLDRDKPSEPKPREEKPAEEVLIKNVQGSTEDVIRPSVTKKPGLSVVGKIDLNKDKKKPAEAPKPEVEKPAKVEPPKAEKAPEPAKAPEVPEAPAVEKTEVEKPVEKKAEPAKPAQPAVPEKAKAPEIETIKTNYSKLSGPTVVGKIDLPEKPKKKSKPVMSTDPGTETQQGRRKRKRIQSQEPAKPAQQQQRGGANTGSSNNNKGAAPKRQPVRGGGRQEISKEDIDSQLKETLAKLSGGSKSKAAKNRRLKRDEHGRKADERLLQEEAESKILRLTEFVTVSDLATLMGVSVTEVISACMSLGIMASINQRLDAETISIVTDEFGYEVEFTTAEIQESIQVEADKPEDLVDRAPIVTVMGHVDHGKTSLLDYVRKENVIAGEAGGITQHIGAYSVEVSGGRRITFLDTPGHEAFTAMRARGAQVTDLAIIVVAADDDVMPQTKEAINHAQAAGIPMVFAINKIDKAGANPEKIKEQLANMNILVEDWGGKFQSQDISAKAGLNIDELLEKVLLEADLLELKANPDKNAVGTVIEATLDKGRGYVTTLLVESGTLKVGDVVLAGHFTGRVKAMYNERGQEIKKAGPSIPVSMLGLSGAPNAGDKFNVLSDEREARSIAARREQLQREQGVRTQKHITLDEIGRRIAIGDFKELNIILKADFDGSVEALTDSLQKLSTDKIQVNVIHKGVGQITESDVLLASASDAVIVGFQVRPSGGARRLAEKEEIQIKLYSVIYAAIEEIKDAMEGMLSARIEERIVGNAEIRETFKISKVGTIAGCFVTDGKINRNSKVRVVRDGIVIYSGSLGSLKRFKDDVKEVAKGYECGLNIDKFNDIKVGDIVEAFEEVEVKQTLAD
jgi:translation initiation factor IF-2